MSTLPTSGTTELASWISMSAVMVDSTGGNGPAAASSVTMAVVSDQPDHANHQPGRSKEGTVARSSALLKRRPWMFLAAGIILLLGGDGRGGAGGGGVAAMATVPVAPSDGVDSVEDIEQDDILREAFARGVSPLGVAPGSAGASKSMSTETRKMWEKVSDNLVLSLPLEGYLPVKMADGGEEGKEERGGGGGGRGRGRNEDGG